MIYSTAHPEKGTYWYRKFMEKVSHGEFQVKPIVWYEKRDLREFHNKDK